MTGGAPAVLAVLAQDVVAAPADDTGRTIMLVIGALLALAVLLAGLTFSYWRRTDPRRRAAQTPKPPAAGAAAAAPSARRATPSAGRTPARGSSPASRPAPPSGEHQRRRQPAGEAISAEEWLRLTGPGPSSGGSRT